MNRFTQALAKRCRGHLLDQKWLVAPSLRVGHQWLETVARSGQPVVNVHVKTVRSLAVDLAGPTLVARQRTLASFRAGALLVDRVLRQLRSGRLKYLGAIEPGPPLCETVLSSIVAIRLAGLAVSDLVKDRFEVPAKGEDLASIVEAYLAQLEAEQLVDYAGVLEIAIARLAEQPRFLSTRTLVLLPEDLPCSALEAKLIAKLPRARRLTLPVVDSDGTANLRIAEMDRQLQGRLFPETPDPSDDRSLHVVRAAGEVNEVRHVLRQCVCRGVRLDEVELLHTDVGVYVPLVYETLSAIERAERQDDDELPVTFTEGIPCRYARPGRALLLWVRWIKERFPQALLIKMVKEGLLKTPDGAEPNGESRSGMTRLAALLRGVAIGFGHDRYLPKLRGQVRTLRSRLRHGFDEEALLAGARRERIELDLQDTKVLVKLVSHLLDVSPAADAPPLEVIAGAKRFAETSTRCVSKLDQFTLQRLVAELTDMEHWLSREPSGIDVWQWLARLPMETRVLGSGPRPGCLHVDSVSGGGHSGRPYTFIVGLDDSRFPGAGIQDPLLLDNERRQLSRNLPTAPDRLDQKVQEFARLLARLRGHVTLCFASRSLDDDREMFPSPALLPAFRQLSGDAEAQQQDLLDSLQTPVSFAPNDDRECLDMCEWWLWRLTGSEAVSDPEGLVLDQFAHLGRGRRAAAKRMERRFTAYDGHVPIAGRQLDPTSSGGLVMSSQMLQTIGNCPRAFFFKYGLDLALPDDVSVDPDIWLDALTLGLLLHELFEQLMRPIVHEHRRPQYDRDHDRLEQLLAALVAQYKGRFAPPSENAFQRQMNQLRQTAHTFLREEEWFCAKHQSVPVYLEASLGMPAGAHGTPLDTPEPVPVVLLDGRRIRARGRVDRIDRVGSGSVQTYCIWDYKTGGTWGYEWKNPFKQGRKVQPYLYVTMVSHRLRQSVSRDAKVGHFGFFFPGTKAVGERIVWSMSHLDRGRKVIDQLCRTVANGAFIATNDFKKDCTYCDFRSICGDLEAVTLSSDQKLDDTGNTMLEPVRELRGAND